MSIYGSGYSYDGEVRLGLIGLGSWQNVLDNGSHWSTGTFCPVGRVVPWDVRSMGHCVRGTFCPLDVLSVERFV